MKELFKLPEPKLLFRFNQELEDPRDGLTLFGPLDSGQIYGIRSGVVGTQPGINRFKDWVQSIQGPVISAKTDAESRYRPFFAGFQTVFGVKWSPVPQIEIPIDPGELARRIRIGNSHQRVFETVSLFADAITDAKRKEDVQVDVWFVVVTEDVEKYCRPLSRVDSSVRVNVESLVSETEAKEFLKKPPLFADMVKAAQPFYYEPDFHNQLKARLLLKEAPIQIVRETTIAPQDFLKPNGFPIRRVDKPSVIAWNISTTAFYKASGRPWKLARVRPGVCYLGLVFKRDERSADSTNACCAAQMFLDSGDGVVFKGAIGPWYSPTSRQFHLKGEAAQEVVKTALETYKAKSSNGHPPKELFIHGRTKFSDEEWEGFKSAVDRRTKLIGVQIKKGDLKVYSNLEYPMLRGMAHIQSGRRAFLWTVGFVPRLQTFVGKEVPNPLFISVCRGTARIEQVLRDILALTKLNYNTCQYGDGMPVTLRFADAVGEILTAGPAEPNASPLPFKFYI